MRQETSTKGAAYVASGRGSAPVARLRVGPSFFRSASGPVGRVARTTRHAPHTLVTRARLAHTPGGAPHSWVHRPQKVSGPVLHVASGMNDASAGVRRPADTSVERLESEEPQSRPGAQQEAQLGAAPRPGTSRASGKKKAREAASQRQQARAQALATAGLGPSVAPPLVSPNDSPAQLGAPVGAPLQGREVLSSPEMRGRARRAIARAVAENESDDESSEDEEIPEGDEGMDNAEETPQEEGAPDVAPNSAPNCAPHNPRPAHSTRASTTADINAALPHVQLPRAQDDDARSHVSDVRIVYLMLSCPGNLEILPSSTILTCIDAELSMVQIAMPQARLQCHDLGKPPRGTGPWMVSVTQEASEYLLAEQELLVATSMGIEIVFRISECDMNGINSGPMDPAEVARTQAARMEANQQRRAKARLTQIMLVYDLPPARLGSLLSEGDLTYETSRICTLVHEALPPGSPTPTIDFNQRRAEEGYYANAVTTYVQFPEGTNMDSIAQGRWHTVKFVPDFCASPRPMCAFMPRPLTDRLNLARCCFRGKAMCEAERGGVCSAKIHAFRVSQSKATEKRARELASDARRDEAFKRRKEAMAHFYCKMYMEGKVSHVSTS